MENAQCNSSHLSVKRYASTTLIVYSITLVKIRYSHIKYQDVLLL